MTTVGLNLYLILLAFAAHDFFPLRPAILEIFPFIAAGFSITDEDLLILFFSNFGCIDVSIAFFAKPISELKFTAFAFD